MYADDGKRIRPCKASTTGQPNRRIIVDKTIDGVEYRYHATKGWRVKTDDPVAKRKAEAERAR